MPDRSVVTTTRRQVAGLIFWLILSSVAAAAGAAASVNAAGFYATLDRPAWAPPSWLFGPVWTVLYLLIAVAAWLVWRERDSRKVMPALSLMIIQLAANALWTWIFFAWRQGGWALAEIIVLWILIVATMAAFWRIRTVAGALFVPYLAWVSFAAALTYSLWQRNPQLL